MAGQEDKGGIRPEDIGESLDLSAADGEPRVESLAEIGKFAQDQIRDDVVAELGYSREDVDSIQPPIRVSHDDDIATHGPLHAAHAAKRDAQNSRLIESEKERLREVYDKHIDAFTELHKDRAAKEAYDIRQEGYRAEIEGIAMSNASQRLIEEAREDPNFDVYGSAQRLQELYNQELGTVAETHTLGRIKANARAAVTGEMNIIRDHIARSAKGAVSPTIRGDSRSTYEEGERLLELILDPNQEALGVHATEALSKWVHNAVFRFAQDNGLEVKAELARMDQLLIRMGYPGILSRVVHGTPGTGGMNDIQHQRRRRYEDRVVGDAVSYLDAAA